MEKLNSYSLFVALTRPPMMLGVTQTFFVLSFVPCFCFLLLSKNLIITFVAFFVLYLFGLLGCAKDDYFFEIFWGNLSLGCPNKKIWGCHSYDPQ